MQNALNFSRYAFVVVVLLAGCAGEPVIPVTDLTSPRGQYAMRMVRPGDTLYMIAWEVGLDYRQLANWNGLVAPYRLTRGTRIRLNAPGEPKSSSDGESRTQATALSSQGSKVTAVAIEVVSGTSESGKKDSSKNQISDWLWPANGPII